ncbi:PREDICTED: cholinesterase 1-like [Priapulus caudatus]|uniref:Carboxylic ester hydrolase n=1 Tax=Priapulus caudatus TaxID=37621 RepID=A0ABM1DWB2_PRICU|nr:PREDICTED: cholinesterase 1-like [Priapulus caudatus]
MRTSLQLTLLILALTTCAAEARPSRRRLKSPITRTTTGRVRGRQEMVLDIRTRIFLGIPYAEPPVGALRFARPQPKRPWRHLLNATERHATCPQAPLSRITYHVTDKWEVNTEISEDCLYLNVWAPKTSYGHLPVIVWIHGGGFFMGSATLDLYDGKYLAAYGYVIVVSMNYRLGALGFMYLGGDAVAGNMGLLDQLLALRWVKENAASFGGDPGRITLMGESAGASAVGYHLLSPLSAGLFSAAILQSSSPLCRYSYSAPERILNLSRKLVTALECDRPTEQEVVDCLREVPAEAFPRTSLQPGVVESIGILLHAFTPTVDNYFLLSPPEKAVTQVSDTVPIMVSSVADEGTFFVMFGLPHLFPTMNSSAVSRAQYSQSVARIFPRYGESTLDVIRYIYSAWPYGDRENARALGAMVGDYHFTCPVNRFALLWAETGADVYMYQFSHRTESSAYPEWIGSAHADDLDYTFGMPLGESGNYTGQERNLTMDVMMYIVNFASTKNPNYAKALQFPGTLIWPRYTNKTRQYFVFDEEESVQTSPRTKHCEIWEKLVPSLEKREGEKVCVATNVYTSTQCLDVLIFICHSPS